MPDVSKVLPSFVLAAVASFAFLPLASATSPHTTSVPPQSSNSIQLAQSTWCSGYGTATHVGETPNYVIYVCNNGDVNYYLSYPKDGSSGIVVACGNGFSRRFTDAVCVAPNGNVEYVVTPSYLYVTEEGDIVLQEEMVFFN